MDQNGGTTTQNKEGIESFDTSIPAEWVSKTLDVCIAVCIAGSMRDASFACGEKLFPILMTDRFPLLLRAMAFATAMTDAV